MKPLRSSKFPANRLLNPAFEWRGSASTDVGRTMQRAYQELERQKREQEAEQNVRQIRKRP